MAISADSLQLTYLSSSPLNSLTDLIISKEVSHLIFGSMALLENLQPFLYFNLVVLLNSRSHSLRDSIRYLQYVQLNRSLGYWLGC